MDNVNALIYFGGHDIVVDGRVGYSIHTVPISDDMTRDYPRSFMPIITQGLRTMSFDDEPRPSTLLGERHGSPMLDGSNMEGWEHHIHSHTGMEHTWGSNTKWYEDFTYEDWDYNITSQTEDDVS
ncbi:ADP-forming family protein [Dorcoceras hygrometricum]|uniref:ADP-forming family protein n=1 Tax=Dorcoceras hygrometricum TaxID=472368 RepID=A0A2Z7C4I1_9LAMI|nr:ADP-forming family protein [Dorcoceras hygrometricum]